LYGLAIWQRGSFLAMPKQSKRKTKIESHLAGKLVKRYASIADAARDFEVEYTTFAPLICRAIKRDWLCYGVRWRRVDEVA